MQATGGVNPKHDIWISKTLSWILRHGAAKEGLSLSPDGFVAVSQLLQCKSLKQKCTVSDVKRVVVNNDKQRFALRSTESGVLEIRANQGHSLSNVVNLELLPIEDPSTIEYVIHGTYIKFWKFIKAQGLHRRRRNHIHFAAGLPGDNGVISGMRKTAEVYIYINLQKALTSGLPFFISANNVILSPGNNEGYITPEYFLKVCLAKDGTELNF